MTEVVRLASDALEVELLPEIGCRLHRLRAFGTDLLRTPADPAAHRDSPFFWGAYVLAPWTNRATAGPMPIAGRQAQLTANFPDGTAIHGHVYDRLWERTGEGSFAVDHDGGGWPWAYRVSVDAGLVGARLTLRYALENRSDAPMPGGLGLHPWFVRPVEVALDGRAVHPRNDDPSAAAVPATGDWALVGDGSVPIGVDATWLDVDPGRIRLHWPSTGRTLLIGARTSASALHVAVASPEQPEAAAVEPVTHAPWALDRRARGEAGGMDLLAPGDRLELVVNLIVGGSERPA